MEAKMDVIDRTPGHWEYVSDFDYFNWRSREGPVWRVTRDELFGLDLENPYKYTYDQIQQKIATTPPPTPSLKTMGKLFKKRKEEVAANVFTKAFATDMQKGISVSQIFNEALTGNIAAGEWKPSEEVLKNCNFTSEEKDIEVTDRMIAAGRRALRTTRHKEEIVKSVFNAMLAEHRRNK